MLNILAGKSFRIKLVLMIWVASTAALLLACGCFIYFEIAQFDKDLAKEIKIIANFVGDKSTSAIMFNDPAIAEDALISAGTVEPAIVIAAIYDTDGKVVAAYGRDVPSDEKVAVPDPRHNVDFIKDGTLHLFSDIEMYSDRLGIVYIQADRHILRKRIQNYAYVVAGILAASILFVAVISYVFQKLVSAPIMDVIDSAKQVSEQEDYTVRVKKQSEDELGLLADSFNAMLSQIQKRDTALRESEALLRKSQTVAHIGSWELDLDVNRLTWSDEVYRICGLRPQEIDPTYEAFLDLIHPDDRAAVDAAYTESVREERDSYDIVHRIVCQDSGEIRVVHEKCDHVRDASGRILRSVGIVQDITERVQTETEREKLEDQLRQSQKMEAVGQLAGGVAHDFNNMLQAILGYGEIALRKVGQDGPIRPLIEDILKAGDRAKNLVRQLLAFSRRQVLDMRNVDLNDVIGETMKMIRRVIGEHVALDFKSGHNLGIVRADRGQIAQILMNLCVNSRDAMPDGGNIVIETEGVRIDEAFCESHLWAEPGHYALLSVTDTGCGMNAETIANIFEPFYTTKGVGEGTGLGLSTVYGLVKQHEGMIHVYSEVGKGTRIKIYLPLVGGSAAADDEEAEGPAPGGTETILLAEDEEVVRDLCKTLLEYGGYTVIVAEDGAEAVRLFDEHADEIDMALLDVMMPKLGGGAVYEHIHQARPDIPVLFASGYSMSAIHTNFVLDQGLALIQKPYQCDELLRKVREVLDQ
jgi:PAS domain S-box-containing protein